MAQSSKFIDITKSFLPVDPRAFPESMHGTRSEDFPNDRIPVSAFEGHNFMPTSYGYRSFFGTTNNVGINSLASRCDKLFLLQTNTYSNILIALCEDGIWTKKGDISGAWVQEVALTIPEEGTHFNWSAAVIGDTLFCYRAKESKYYYFSPDNLVPSVAEAAPNAVTGLAVAYNPYGTSLPIGTYDYQIAAYDSNERLSLPSAVVTKVLSAAGRNIVSWNILAGATAYRLYRTSGGVTKYVDLPQITGTGTYAYEDINTFVNTVTLPDPKALEVEPYTAIGITPNFLNMAGQIGIFRAGGRLGFWDSDDSIAWSSIDDFADFKPSVETLAGSAKFKDVNGRITTIVPHGEGFVIYSTKSIVRVAQRPDATFQWDPTTILSESGVAYPEEVVAGNPDTTHYAFTPTGLYKIEGVQAAPIVPEITDFLKEMKEPVFLRLLEGRYLFLQILNKDYLDGLVEFDVNTIPPTTYTFPGAVSGINTLTEGVILTGDKFCSALGDIGAGATTEQQAAGAAAAAAAGASPQAGAIFQPVWTCYLSKDIGDPSGIEWGSAPCPTIGPDGVEANMAPVGNAGKVNQLGTGTANKVGLTGSEAGYIDGIWTIERFVALQTALWETGDKNRQAFINALSNRAHTASKTTKTVTCVASGPTESECEIGEYVVGGTGPSFSLSACTFRLTRFITRAMKLIRVKSDQVTCAPITDADAPRPKWSIPGLTAAATPTLVWTSSGITYNDPYSWSEAIHNKRSELAAAWGVTPTNAGDGRGFRFVNPIGNETSQSVHIEATPSEIGYYNEQPHVTNAVIDCGNPDYKPQIDLTAGWPPVVVCVRKDGTTQYNKVETMYAHNKAVEIPIAPIPDSPFCTITGWKFTNSLGVEQVVPAASCTSPALPPSNPPFFGTPSLNEVPAPNVFDLTDGTFCSKPFEPVTIPAISGSPIVWPPQTVTLPAGSFLLQNGSIGPIYPTFEGALVYDLHLKKWGKMKLPYKQLLDYAPINNSAGDTIPYETFGMNAGVLKADGFIYVFDTEPEDSYIKYGKIGYYRLGFTDAEEVMVHLRVPGTGFVELGTSLDGRQLEALLTRIEPFANQDKIVLKGGYSGRWHTITVRGHYDIQYMEFRGVTKSRR